MSLEKLLWFRIKRAEELKDTVSDDLSRSFVALLEREIWTKWTRRTLDNVSRNAAYIAGS